MPQVLFVCLPVIRLLKLFVDMLPSLTNIWSYLTKLSLTLSDSDLYLFVVSFNLGQTNFMGISELFIHSHVFSC